MARPIQQVRIYAVQSRRGAERVRLPYIVRWSIDGRQRSRSFRTKAMAWTRLPHVGHPGR